MQMIKRELYLNRIRPVIDKAIIKVLTGMRRSGKSVLLSQIAEEIQSRGVDAACIITLNFEDFANARLCSAEALHAFIKAKADGKKSRLYVLLDEIQEVGDWQKCVNSLSVSTDCDLYITGSNARLLSGELATYLGGRYVEFEIYPLSFREFTAFAEVRDQDLKAEFLRYVRYGGMPFLRHLDYEDLPVRQYLHDLYSSVMVKDIIVRNGIRDAALLERFINYMAANDGQPFSSLAISKYFKSRQIRVTPETLLNYLKACCGAFLFKEVKLLDLKGKRMLSGNGKFYLCDHALQAVVSGEAGREVGLMLENIVALELYRRGYEVYTGRVGAQEIDFVAQRDGARIYVQVCYLLSSPGTVEREFSVFRTLQDRYPCYVLSLDEIDMSRDGVRHMKIWDFLLAESW